MKHLNEMTEGERLMFQTMAPLVRKYVKLLDRLEGYQAAIDECLNDGETQKRMSQMMERCLGEIPLAGTAPVTFMSRMSELKIHVLAAKHELRRVRERVGREARRMQT